ncbi:MAG: hypothetical protein FJ096_02245 [Deltaproteobacteria bacterium]|nr:hypothetical protein [Deltaproteobacteria bacterium]
MRCERWLVGGVVVLTACASPARAPSSLRLDPYPVQVARDDVAQVALDSSKPKALDPPPVVTPSPPLIAAGSRLELARRDHRLTLSPGRYAVRVELPPGRTVMLGVSGPARALKLFEVLGRGRLTRLKTEHGDGELPNFVTFKTRSEPEPLLVVLDADASVTLHRLDLAPFDALGSRRGDATAAAALVGMPTPTSSKAGYHLSTPPRYAFVRADVAEALRLAFRQVVRRYHRETIAVGDATQWNGDRPASDRQLARHVTHHEGRDVDLGLPGTDGSSAIKSRCAIELEAPDRAICKPGSVAQLDVERLAYLLAALVEGPSSVGRRIVARHRTGPVVPVERILADAAYVAAIRSVLPALRKRRWIKDETAEALASDDLLRASPWHTDHVHVRFAVGAAQLSGALREIAAMP